MRLQSSARKVLVITILLISANAGAGTWELRPAAGSAPGTTEIEAGRIDDAIERYKDFAASFSGEKSNANFYYGIAATKAYQALGEQEKARALIDQLISAISAST